MPKFWVEWQIEGGCEVEATDMEAAKEKFYFDRPADWDEDAEEAITNVSPLEPPAIQPPEPPVLAPPKPKAAKKPKGKK